MPAANTDKFIKVASNTGWQLDASGISDSSVTSFGLVSATSLPTDTAVILTIDRVNSSGVATPSLMERIVGVMSGTTVTSCVRGLEGTAQAHAAGAVVEIVISKSNINKLMEGILVEHNQDGTHKETALDSMIAGIEAQGDIIYHDGSVWNRLPKGTDGQFLKLASSIPSWSSVGDWNPYTAVTPTTGTLDSPSFPIVFAGVDLTSVISVGMRVKITQSTTKYFIVTAIAFSTDTTITLYGGTDYSLVASGTTAISAFSYSSMKAPVGFPLDPTKWSVKVTDTTERSAAGTGGYDNIGTTNSQISIPIGVWNVYFHVNLSGDRTTSGTGDSIRAALSTANNSASDGELVAYAMGYGSGVASSSDIMYGSATRQKTLVLAAKTLYYLNGLMENSGTVYFKNTVGAMVIRATIAYL